MIYQQIKQLPPEYVKTKIKEFLAEDAPNGDVTTLLTISPDETTKARVIAQSDLVFVGEFVLPYFFDESFEFHLYFTDGNEVNKGDVIAEVTGNKRYILLVERTLLNLLQRMCGIATKTRQYTNLAEPYGVKILDTRKTLPGLRLFDKYSVAAAGGSNHRTNLSNGILIKDNHIAGKDLKKLLSKVKNDNSNKLFIELEIDNIEQLKIALEFEIDGYLLDNMTPEQIKECVQIIRSQQKDKHIFIEASGGINIDNILGYLNTGIDAISIGSLTHSVKAAEIHLEFE